MQLLVKSGPPNVILLREKPTDTIACGTFDYSDLNAYLLVVVGLAEPEPDQLAHFDSIAKRARDGTAIPLRDIEHLAKKGPLIKLFENDNLAKAIEQFGSGVHRILIYKEDGSEVVGILSQLKLVRFLWDNGSSFASIDELYPNILKDLSIGAPSTIAIK